MICRDQPKNGIINKMVIMNELVDFGFLAAKVAAIGNEKAKMTVDGVSLAYNVVQINRFR